MLNFDFAWLQRKNTALWSWYIFTRRKARQRTWSGLHRPSSRHHTARLLLSLTPVSLGFLFGSFISVAFPTDCTFEIGRRHTRQRITVEPRGWRRRFPVNGQVVESRKPPSSQTTNLIPFLAAFSRRWPGQLDGPYPSHGCCSKNWHYLYSIRFTR